MRKRCERIKIGARSSKYSNKIMQLFHAMASLRSNEVIISVISVICSDIVMSMLNFHSFPTKFFPLFFVNIFFLYIFEFDFFPLFVQYNQTTQNDLDNKLTCK